jgi:putative ABC transport system substrate-binding protein
LASDLFELYRYGAHQIDHPEGRAGARHSIYESTKFQLLLNVKAASDLRIVLPPSLLARADEVIE